MKKEMNNKGFSLVELIIVIAIMAILVGVLAPQYLKYVEKSRQSTDMQNMQSLKTAVEAAVASGDVIGNAVLETTTSEIKIDTTTLSALNAANAGVTSPIALKSAGWNVASFTYNVSTYKWDTPSAAKNSKAPNDDMASVFVK